MKISFLPPESVVRQTKTWLKATLESDEFNNNRAAMPASFQGFVDETATSFMPGSWQRDGRTFYIGQPSSCDMHALDKLGALIAVASWARLLNDSEIVDAITKAFSREILKGLNSLFEGLIYSNQPVLKLAIGQDATLLCEMGDGENRGWYAPNGARSEPASDAIIIEGVEPPTATAPVTPPAESVF
jgi:hypothetical protein